MRYTEKYAQALKFSRGADMDTVKGIVASLTPEELKPGSNKLMILADAVQDTGDEDLAQAIRHGQHNVHWEKYRNNTVGLKTFEYPSFRTYVPELNDTVSHSLDELDPHSPGEGDWEELSQEDKAHYHSLVSDIHEAEVRLSSLPYALREVALERIARESPDLQSHAEYVNSVVDTLLEEQGEDQDEE